MKSNIICSPTTEIIRYKADNYGQIKESKADAEIARLNAQEQDNENPRVWVKDYSDELYCPDETDDNVFNPCSRAKGYCWIVTE